MPEGPEVRRNRDDLAHHLLGQQLTALTLLSGKYVKLGLDVDKLKLPAYVKDVQVKGKLLLISLTSGTAITSTLGMSGWWYHPTDANYGQKAYYNGKMLDVRTVIDNALRHARFELVTSTGVRMQYTDPRNFGNLKLWSQEELEETHPFDKLGLDLLNDAAYNILEDPDDLEARVLKLKQTATKRQLNLRLGDLCLEQEFICGLGNIYRAEVLYLAGLSPYETLKDLDDDSWLKLIEVSTVVLSIAYHNSGRMIYPLRALIHLQPKFEEYFKENLQAANIKQASINQHLVYGQGFDPIGNKVIADKAFDRTMWWCPTMQDN